MLYLSNSLIHRENNRLVWSSNRTTVHISTAMLFSNMSHDGIHQIPLFHRAPGVVSNTKQAEPMKIGPVPTASIRPNARKQKDPGLTFQFPSKVGEYELRILAQPEEQHRARYLTEGSRGAVKDRSQQGYPVIKVGLFSCLFMHAVHGVFFVCFLFCF